MSAPAAAYYRVSTKKQGLDVQRLAVEQAAARRGESITCVYEEKRSARTTARPELQRLLQDARAGRLPPVLYVFRIDRLHRGKIGELLSMVQELESCGVALISACEDIPLKGLFREFFLAGLALGAGLELSAQEDRRASAREERAGRGLPFGGPLKVERDDPRLPEALRRWRAGETLRTLAQHLGIKRDTLHRRLRELALQGLSQESPPVSGPAAPSDPLPLSQV